MNLANPISKSAFEISISHSRSLATVLAAPVPVGVDIQKIVSKIERIAHKFMNQAESESLQVPSCIPHLHVYWGAKEALYKAYGRRQLDFKKHILIDPFSYDEAGGTITGSIHFNDFHANYQLSYERIDREFVLVYARESHRQTAD